MKITILNWTKINGRKDLVYPQWFKLKNKFFDDSEFYSFSHEERCAWLYLLCECSKQNKNGEVELNFVHADRNAQISEMCMISAIIKLQSLHIVSCDLDGIRSGSGRNLDGIRTESAQQNRREENRLENTNVGKSEKKKIPASASPRCEIFNFEDLYKKYPRKEGKSRGMKICKAQIRSPEDYAALQKAIDRYAAHCIAKVSDPKFIQLFSTFMGSWRDWLDPATGTVSVALSSPDKPKSRYTQEEIDGAFSTAVQDGFDERGNRLW